MKIHKLIFQEKNDNSYETIELGYFSSIEKVKEAIPNFVIQRKDGDSIYNIYTRDITIDIETDECNNYTFFDEEGNITSSYQYGLVGQVSVSSIKTPKFKIGDIVEYYPDDGKEIEIGIVSALPEKIDNVYIVLLGVEIHNHVHPIEQFLRLFESDEYYNFTQALNDRLKIGY
jgi:hypothetical protein